MKNKSILFKIFIFINSLLFISSQTISSHQTPKNDDGDGYVTFLDRHNVACPHNSVLQGFHVFRPTDSTISIKYQCLEVYTLTDNVGDYTETTGWTDAKNGFIDNNYTGDRLQYIPVYCNNNYALKSFRLESTCDFWGCQIRFRYTCTPLKVVTCSSGSTSTADCYDGQNFTLNRVSFFLSDFNVLTGFKLNVSYYSRLLKFDGRNFKMSYNYCQTRNIQKEIDDYKSSKPQLPEHNYLRILDSAEEKVQSNNVSSKSTATSVSLNKKSSD